GATGAAEPTGPTGAGEVGLAEAARVPVAAVGAGPARTTGAAQGLVLGEVGVDQADRRASAFHAATDAGSARAASPARAAGAAAGAAANAAADRAGANAPRATKPAGAAQGDV